MTREPVVAAAEAEAPDRQVRAVPRARATGRAPGLLRRMAQTWRHVLGLAAGGLTAWVRRRRAEPGPRGAAYPLARVASVLVYPFLDHDIVDQPFPVQLRRRLELLGPTYVKFGQILSLRTDLLPDAVTVELRNLLDSLPAAPWEEIRAIIEADLGVALEEAFRTVETEPLGSASIAQTHRAVTVEGDDVILKVVKPGIRSLLKRDGVLLRIVGRLLEMVVPQYRPLNVIEEFIEYTLREVDMVREADNAETFAASFRDLKDHIVFPRVYREWSGRNVLCLEFMDGVRPDSLEALGLSEEDRRELIDVGAEVVVRMLYRDGFFHADLHPANILVLPGPRLAFLDLGMVGRLDSRLRRLLLYYYYCLVIEDYENASRYLAAVAQPTAGSDPAGFRKEVEDISRRWRRARRVEDFSLAQLILESVRQGGRYRMYFPVEMVLMVKALVTYEGVGMLLDPGFNVAEVTHRHVVTQFRHQFSPLCLAREGIRRAPDLMDAFISLPTLVTEGLRLVESRKTRRESRPFSGTGGILYGGFCLLAGSVLAVGGAPWPAWTILLALGGLIPILAGRGE